jgi:hypothetical protein
MVNLQERYPTLYDKIEDKELDECRYFVVVDENYEDIDDEEVDVFDPHDYNYLVYITERTQAALGKDGIEKLYFNLEKDENIENFLASEEDLYGLKSELSDEELSLLVLDKVEEILKELA